MVPGQMYSLSRMEGLKKEPTQIKRMEKKKPTQGKFRRKNFFPGARGSTVQCNIKNYFQIGKLLFVRRSKISDKVLSYFGYDLIALAGG